MSYEADYERATALGRAIVERAGGDPELEAETIACVADRSARVWLLRDRWERLSRPALSKGSKRQTTAHPMLRSLQDAESALLDAKRALTPAGDGRIGPRLPHLKADLTRRGPSPLSESPAAQRRRAHLREAG
ncbi:MAG TPA: hypothetical protein VFG74_02245 [Miltoncostaeaceae bacterium]|nr:hypothetical protein [Miltoncostaeaceae bacterium]